MSQSTPQKGQQVEHRDEQINDHNRQHRPQQHGYNTRSRAFATPATGYVPSAALTNTRDESVQDRSGVELDDNIIPIEHDDNTATEQDYNNATENDDIMDHNTPNNDTMNDTEVPVTNNETQDDLEPTSPIQPQPQSPPGTPANITSRDLKEAIALYKQMHAGNRTQDPKQVMRELMDQDTPRTRYQKRKLLISPDAAPAQQSTSQHAKRQHEARRSDISSSSNSGNSSAESRSKKATLKKRQQRKRLFGHRVKQYKTTSLGRQKFNISKANRMKRDAQLKSKRDQRWLFTSMSQSTPQKGQQGETSFDSISDIEGAYREDHHQTSSDSPPSPDSTEDNETEQNQADVETHHAQQQPKSIMVKTPKLRPSRLHRDQPGNTSWGEHVHGQSKREREIQNMLSLWAAQKRAKDMEKEALADDVSLETSLQDVKSGENNDDTDNVADQ